MKLLTYQIGDVVCSGVLAKDGDHVLSFQQLGFSWSSIQELCDDPDPIKLTRLKQAWEITTKMGDDLETVRILAPIPEVRRDMICIGFNFKKHAQEIARLRGENEKSADISYPIYFSKRIALSSGQGDTIPYVKGYAENLDVGVEVCPVIGKDALNVRRDQVEEYLLGYTITNDVCDTRLNKVYTQPFLGKSIDGYMPVGPWIVTTDEFPHDPVFHLKLTVNGKIRQEGDTTELSFDIPYIISELSRDMTMKAGTMIATGSPANLEAGHPEKLLLRPGDEICCEISGIGKLNNVVEERKDKGA